MESIGKAIGDAFPGISTGISDIITAITPLMS
jgi:hypothetical protein